MAKLSRLAQLYVFSFCVLLHWCGSTVLCMNQYVRVLRASVNIRTEPSTRSAVVGAAKRGDVFEMTGENGRWYEIHLFSAQSRYIHKSLAQPLSYVPEVPEDISVRRQIFRAWAECTARAEEEAARRYPPNENLDRNLEYGQLLDDRYKLGLMHRFELQPPAYRRIVIEGFQKGW